MAQVSVEMFSKQLSTALMNTIQNSFIPNSEAYCCRWSITVAKFYPNAGRIGMKMGRGEDNGDDESNSDHIMKSLIVLDNARRLDA